MGWDDGMVAWWRGGVVAYGGMTGWWRGMMADGVEWWQMGDAHIQNVPYGWDGIWVGWQMGNAHIQNVPSLPTDSCVSLVVWLSSDAPATWHRVGRVDQGCVWDQGWWCGTRVGGVAQLGRTRHKLPRGVRPWTAPLEAPPWVAYLPDTASGHGEKHATMHRPT
jgi:hypothetical protein